MLPISLVIAPPGNVAQKVMEPWEGIGLNPLSSLQVILQPISSNYILCWQFKSKVWFHLTSQWLSVIQIGTVYNAGGFLGPWVRLCLPKALHKGQNLVYPKLTVSPKCRQYCLVLLICWLR